MFFEPVFSVIARPLRNVYVGCYRPMVYAIEKVSNEPSVGKHKDFIVKLDVHKYSPKDITVKTIDNSIIIEGRHKEKVDEHGFVSRHFVRRYVLPTTVRIESVSSTLSSDGVLTVSAPEVSNMEEKERLIPIVATGKEDGDADEKHSS